MATPNLGPAPSVNTDMVRFVDIPASSTINDLTDIGSGLNGLSPLDFLPAWDASAANTKKVQALHLQQSLSGRNLFLVTPTNGTTAPGCIGGVLTTATTISHQQTIASANPWQATRRTRFQTSTTAGNATGLRTGYGQWYRGNAAGFGGWYFRAELGANINLNGGQKFVGLCASTAVLGGDPSALVNMCGMGYDAADASTGNWFFMRNDGTGTATKVDLGATHGARGTTQGWDLQMWTLPNGSDLFVKIINVHTGGVALDTSYTTDLPAVNTALAVKAEVRNGAVAAADNLEIARIYIESD